MSNFDRFDILFFSSSTNQHEELFEILHYVTCMKYTLGIVGTKLDVMLNSHGIYLIYSQLHDIEHKLRGKKKNFNVIKYWK
jgi:hypothetical protein